MLVRLLSYILVVVVVLCALAPEAQIDSWLYPALAEPEKDTASGNLNKQAIVPLRSGVSVEEVIPSQLENLNQCPGTVQHYRLPPTGYPPAAKTAASQAGQRLYEERNCQSCHAIEGKGGTLGPPLDGIGGHRGREWLTARLLDPAQQMLDFPEAFGGRPNIMPHPGLSRRHAAQIAQYLLTLPEPEGGFLIIAHAAIPMPNPSMPYQHPKDERARKTQVERGRALFIEHGCAMCHSVSGDNSKFSPNLSGISQRRDRQSLEKLLSGGATQPVMKAQSVGLDKEDVNSIIEFLLSLPHLSAPTVLSPGN